MHYSFQAFRVLTTLSRRSTQQVYGLELSKKLNIQSGTLYPMLNRMADEGLLRRVGEKGKARTEARPLRNYYFITAKGQAEAKKMMKQFT